MQEERQKISGSPLTTGEAVSWWSWRPGIKPIRALLLGGLLTLLGLFLLVNGLASLVAGLLDGSASPIQATGTVIGHGKDLLGSPQLTIQLKQVGFPPLIMLTVSSAASLAIGNGTTVTIDYGPHLHTPYALIAANHSYALPGTSPSGNLFGALTLLIFGLVLLPYPAMLSYWGWRDLHAGKSPPITASVVALRAARQTTTRTPGLVPRTTSTWHGVALQADLPSIESRVLIFGIRPDLHKQLRLGDRVQVIYSLNLHYLYTLKHLEQT